MSQSVEPRGVRASVAVARGVRALSLSLPLLLAACGGSGNPDGQMPVNQPPVVDAGADLSADEGAAVSLSGSARDPEGAALTLRWEQLAGPAVTLSDAQTLSPRFTAPLVDAATTLRFRLTATDPAGASASDEVVVAVRDLPANQPPTVEAGADQTVASGARVVLSASASDADGTVVRRQWTQLAGPSVSLSGADTATAQFTAPTVSSETLLRFRFVAEDNDGAEASDELSVRVLPPVVENQAPTVSAGADQSVEEGSPVQLAGSASDADGEIRSLRWTQLAGPSVSLSGADSANASFTAPAVDADTELRFQLSATDDDGASASATVRVQVRNVPANQPPVAQAGADQSVDEGASVTLAGRGEDSDGRIASYQWTQTAGPSVALAGASSATASFTAPQVDAETLLRFRLTVTDDDGASGSDELNVTVRDVPPGDDDGDGVSNASDLCPGTAAGAEVDAQGCSAAQRDGDGDGVSDAADLCPGTPAGTTVDASGCPVSDGGHASCASGKNLAGNRSYQVLIGSESGEQISFQVLEPKSFDCARRAQGAHPLILQGHGFGGARSTSGFDDYRAAGFAVISIDQRGFGDSSGTVRVMDPDYEGKDLIRILDWAEQNLDYLAWRDQGAVLKPFVARPANGTSQARGANLLVGAIGGSYGGGYQMLLQNVDPKERLDALAPDIAWHDLRWSLNPGDVIKTGWDLLLVAGGSAGSYLPGLQNAELPTGRGLDPYILETLARGAATGEFPREALDWFRYHSPAYWCGLNGQPAMPYTATDNAPFDFNFMLSGFLNEAPGGNTRSGQPGIPVLLSQGFRDTLFNFNDGWWNYQCLAARGDDVRLISHQSGHILNGFVDVPLPQLNFGNTGGNGDCGQRPRGAATLEWFREKLKGEAAAEILRGTEDALCISLADGDAVDIPAEKFLAPRPAQGGLPLSASYYAAEASVAAVPQGVPADVLHLAGLPRPGIAPLLTVTDSHGLLLAGIAQAEVKLSTPQMVNDLLCAQAQLPTLRTGCDAIVFVGLGLKKAGESDYTLIDDQVLPVRGLGEHPALSLVGVAERLAVGDSLALLVYGYSPQYLLSFSRDPSIPVVNVEAALRLPLYGVGADGKPDFGLAVADLVTPAAPEPGQGPAPAYGTGLLGAVGSFGAGFNGVLAALLGGDPASALAQLQTVVVGLVADLVDLLVGDQGSLLALLSNLGGNLAAADPQTALEQAGDDTGALLGLDTDPLSALQRTASAARQVEAVVMTGNQLPGWSAPSAAGLPHPYPSGTGLVRQCESAGLPEALCQGVGGLLSGTPLDPDIRSAHNGTFLYPPGWKPGDEPVSGGVPVNEIAAFAYGAEGWREIPVQVDEKYPYFLANSHSDFGIYSGTDEELSYAWDLERWNPGDSEDGCNAVAPAGTPDPVGGLDDDDELVFMARDAGGLAPVGERPPGVPEGSASQLVTLVDALNPASTRVVYLFRRPGGSSFAGKPHYVRYTRDANADQWIDRTFFADDDTEKLGTSNTGYGANLSGTVCHPTEGKKQSTDRFPRDGVSVQTDTYVWKASGRWMVREIGIAKPDGSGNYGADILDRWKGRAFQQSPDSTISLVGFEDEQVNWEANSSLLGERCGPVRCIREVWGADSGTNVTKTETFYRDAISYRYHVRVHPIPPDGLYTSWDYNRSAMVPTPEEQKAGVPGGRYYTLLRPQGVPIDGVNDDFGQIDSIAPIAGYCLTSDGPQPSKDGRCPLFLDVADPSFNLPLAFANWEQISAKGDLGSLVYTFELKGLTSLATPAVVPYYRDDACLDDGTGDDPVRRPWPGEASTDARVVAGYQDRNGDGVVGCEERQGVYGAHGIHYFLTADVDNAFVLGKPINEIDGLQWQFMVPTAQPTNVGEPYANVSRIPLKPVAVPLGLALPGGLPQP
ncbi:hypothetical protein ED208_15995 [Stagnimonas aquatica]|uniref:PKD/Chitinase domain-containing protein n=1 Tax=Stagnimonas aquatica TaxID=2689987 RepID=A0A3N0V1E5_9GAMM|nr:CocE/NonD family hydrolase [Stagnimonas aquatica]ROH86533.1 hypothetical protein ED208_15995 [Stagnimonas aquatica]